MDIFQRFFRRPKEQKVAEKAPCLRLEQLSSGPLFQTQRDQRKWQDDATLRVMGNTWSEISYHEVTAQTRDEAARRRESWKAVYREWLKAIANVQHSNNFPVLYVWKAYAHAGLGEYEDAFASIVAGLNECADKLPLCRAMADLKFEQRKIEAFGWWMQGCMLAAQDCMPYLYLSVTAAETNMLELSLRLLNASDVLSPGMYRLDLRMDREIRELARQDIERVRKALERFEKYMDPFLPASTIDHLPPPADIKERGDALLYQRLAGESSPVVKAAIKLVSRPH